MAKRERGQWRCQTSSNGTQINVDGAGVFLWIGVSNSLPTVLHTHRLARRICRAVNKVEGREGAKHGKA